MTSDLQEQVKIEENPPQSSPQDNKDNQQEEIEIVDAPSEEAEKDSEIVQQKTFDPKTDRVDFSTPEQEAKFNHVYKQMKMSDSRNQLLNEMLQKQQQRLDDLETRFKNTDSADAEKMLMNKIRSARDSGDDAAEISALNELVEFKADKKILENSHKVQQSQQSQNNYETQSANYVASLMQETDIEGKTIRPYLYEGHPDFENSISMLDNISQKYAGDPQAVPKSLAELDQFMKAKMTNKQTPSNPSSRTPNPMQGGNLTNVNKKTTIKMTRAESDMLNKLNKSLPPGEKISPQRYAARLEKTRGKK